MRIVVIVIGMLLSVMTAKADQVVVSGKVLQIYQTYSINPDCSPTGEVVVRVAQAPEHGSVSIRHANVFPYFAASNPRSSCNRRRVAGVRATYVSQRGYVGSDYVELEVFYPNGSGGRVRSSIEVK